MDLENTWQESSGSDDMLGKMLHRDNFQKLQSKLPLRKLKKNLLTGIVLGVIITAGYVALLFYVNAWQVIASFCTLIMFNTWVMIETWKLYKKTKTTITPSDSVKEELQKNYDSFRNWSSLQQKVSLFVYPVAATGGFILGGMSGSGKSAEEFMNDYRVLIVLGITIVVLVPICYYFARWMFKHLYGNHLKKLKDLIEELS